MKRLYAAVIFLIVALMLGIFSYSQLEKRSRLMEELIGRVQAAEKADDTERMKQCAEEAGKQWKKNSTFFHIFLDHKEMNNVEMSIEKTQYYAKRNDRENTRLCAEDCAADFRHIERSVKPTFSNIF